MKNILSTMAICAIALHAFAQTPSTQNKSTGSTGALDGKSFKISLVSTDNSIGTPGTSSGDKNMNRSGAPTDNTGTRSSGSSDNSISGSTTDNSVSGTSPDKRSSSSRTNTTDKNDSKTVTLRFENGKLVSSFASMKNIKECTYSTTGTTTDGISFYSTCTMPGSTKGQKSNSSMNNNNSGGSTPATQDPSMDNGTSGTMTQAGINKCEWSGTVTGSNINGTLTVADNGSTKTYSFTGSQSTDSKDLGINE